MNWAINQERKSYWNICMFGLSSKYPRSTIYAKHGIIILFMQSLKAGSSVASEQKKSIWTHSKQGERMFELVVGFRT